MQKYVFSKLNLKVKWQYFRYKEFINWLLINEILTYVFMYGGPSTSFLRYEPLKNDVTIFLAWKRVFAIFLHRGLLVCKNEKLNCFDIQCVVEASSFGLNHNMTLESKENYPRYTKTVQNSLGFMPEVKPLHKPRGDLVLSARSVCLLCPTLNGLDLMDSDFLSFCIGQRLPTLVYCIDTSVAPTNIHNAQSYGESLASTDQCTVMKSECTISLTNIRFCSQFKNQVILQ